MDDREIRELFATHEVKLGQKDVWKVQGKTPVIKHSALERLAAKLKISWDEPREVIASMDEVVILARGTRPDGISEWSYGEVKVVKSSGDGGNYKITGAQPGYPFAMAEKRAKDRVIIKLAGLHGAYSEEEAEDFAARNADSSGGRRDRDEDGDEDRGSPTVAPEDEAGTSDPAPEQKPRGRRTAAKAADKPKEEAPAANDDEPEEVKALRAKIEAAETINAVTDLMLDEDTQRVLNAQSHELRESLRDAGKIRLRALGWPKAGSKAA